MELVCWDLTPDSQHISTLILFDVICNLLGLRFYFEWNQRMENLVAWFLSGFFFYVIELELPLFFLCVDILLRCDFIWELLIQQYLSHHYFFSLIWITTAMADSGLIILLVLNIWRGLISNSIQAIEKLQPSLYRFLEILGKTRRKSRVSLLLPSHNYTTLPHCVFISI